VASLDTNCVLRWFLDDVPDQRTRVEALLASGEAMTVDDAVVIESVYALETGAKLSRKVIREYWETAMTHAINVNRSLWVQVLGIWVEYPKLSVVDVYLATKAGTQGTAPLYTFDAKMVRQLANTSTVP